jgi:hypothetical protein
MHEIPLQVSAFPVVGSVEQHWDALTSHDPPTMEQHRSSRLQTVSGAPQQLAAPAPTTELQPFPPAGMHAGALPVVDAAPELEPGGVALAVELALVVQVELPDDSPVPEALVPLGALLVELLTPTRLPSEPEREACEPEAPDEPDDPEPSHGATS